MKTSEMINEISKAMSLAQGEMKPASKSTVNPFFKSTYSTLAQVMDAIREPFSKNNLCVFQDVCSTETGVAITTRVCHASGQWIEFGPMVVPYTKKDAQGVGSATSYGKRYSLSAAVGVVSDLEDDDGESAMNRNGNQEKNGKEKPPKVEKREDNVIDEKEVQQLQSILETCDKEYVNKLWSYLMTLDIKGLENLPKSMFNKILNGVMQNAELNKKK